MDECLLNECQRPLAHQQMGWCSFHYRKWNRYGDLNYVKKPPSKGPNSKFWRGSKVTYRTAHSRVSDLWGTASLYPCVSCGSESAEWAYDGTDPEEKDHLLRGKYLMKYSAFPEFYMPMCIPCHRKMDEYQDFCIHGHAMTEENIGKVSTRPGRRICRQCSRRRGRQTYSRKKQRLSG